ncbi:MAG: hypothetical protein ACKOWF_12865 [Chloroflexota bacterium]
MDQQRFDWAAAALGGAATQRAGLNAAFAALFGGGAARAAMEGSATISGTPAGKVGGGYKPFGEGDRQLTLGQLAVVMNVAASMTGDNSGLSLGSRAEPSEGGGRLHFEAGRNNRVSLSNSASITGNTAFALDNGNSGSQVLLQWDPSYTRAEATITKNGTSVIGDQCRRYNGKSGANPAWSTC